MQRFILVASMLFATLATATYASVPPTDNSQVQAEEIEEVTQGQVVYRLNHTTKKGTVLRHLNPAHPTPDEIEIPQEVNGCTITEIAEWAFYNDGGGQAFGLNGIKLPDTIEKIGNYAFSWQHSLDYINWPTSLTYIGEGAFECNVNSVAHKHLKLPPTVTYIGDKAFFWCEAMQSLEIPSNLKRIGNSVFASERHLKLVIIPHSVEEIGVYAFNDCERLEFVSFHDRVNSIGEGAFSNCPALTTINLPKSLKKLADGTFSGCKSLSSIEIPEFVREIGNLQKSYDGVFENCTSLTSIRIPNSVAILGAEAFAGCTALETVTFGNSVTALGENVFKGCTALPSLEIPHSVTTIGERAFEGYSGLTSMTIPDKVSKIEPYTFADCSALTAVTIPSSVTAIGNNAFKGCTALPSLEIPSLVNKIEPYTFAGCAALNSVEIPYSVTELGHHAFEGAGLESVTLSNNLTSIEEGTFKECQKLQAVDIPQSVTSLGKEVFYNCRSLQKIYIPDPVKSIPEKAFYNCTSLQKINLPGTVEQIGSSAFEQCSSLKKVTLPESVAEIGTGAFVNCIALDTIESFMIEPPVYNEFFTRIYIRAICVPEGAIANYQDKGWPAEFILPLDEVIEEYVLDDASTLYAETSEKRCSTLKYVRDFPKANTWQAFYVPFDISYDELAADFDVARLNNIHQFDDDKDGDYDRWYLEVLYLKNGSTLKANVPYVIRPKMEGEHIFTLTNATLKPARKGVLDCSSTAYKYVFTGTYEGLRNGEMAQNHYYALNADGELVYTTNPEVELGGFRWYLAIEPRPGATANQKVMPARIKLIEGNRDDVTGVEGVEAAGPTGKLGKVYDLNGRVVSTDGRLDKLPKGFYIVNGQKVIK